MGKRIVGRDVKNVYEAGEIVIKAMGAIPEAHIVDYWTRKLDAVRRHIKNVARESGKGGAGFWKYKRACTKYLRRT